jgi:hypothetical protein
MKFDGQIFLKVSEIRIRAKDRHPLPYRNSTDEKVGVGTLNTFTPADIVKFGGRLEIAGRQFEIRKWTEMVAKLRELGMASDSGKDFLPYRSNQLYP